MSYLDGWNMSSPPRPQQVDVLQWMDTTTSRTLNIHAPCGTGKSGIVAAVANQEGGVVCTPSKFLQDQYLRDWPDAKLLKGKQNYTCPTAVARKRTDPLMSGLEPNCKVAASWCKNKSCPYAFAKAQFCQDPMGITNYSWLMSALKGSVSLNQKWLLFDEAHELEPKLIDAATIILTEKMCNDQSLDFERFKNPVKASDWLITKVYPRLKDRYDVLIDSINLGGDNVPSHLIMEADMLNEIVCAIDFMEARYGEEVWVYNLEDTQCSFRPLFANGLFQHSISPLGKRHLLTSATMCPAKLTKRWLGLGDDVDEYSLDSPFPVENRLVFIEPVAYLNKDNLDTKLPVVASAISMIMGDHDQDKGIIHCNSYALGEKIMSLLPPDDRARILLHTRSTSREHIMQVHQQSAKPTVVMSPSMTEGVDLYGNLSRFTIIAKTPYPYLGDLWVRERLNADRAWYNWQIAKTVMQGVGRSVRSNDDYASAYILDGTFLNFFNDNRNLFPSWFKRSVVLPK